MGTNYSRRLGCGDSFLTTKQKGKRIEVKSDLLTKIYNNKIMKNLKQMIDDFQSEAKKRIANGEFEVLEAETSRANGYFANVKIKIDDVLFDFVLPNDKNFICDLSVVKIYSFGICEKEFKSLENAFKTHTQGDRDKEIARLEEIIENIKK